MYVCVCVCRGKLRRYCLPPRRHAATLRTRHPYPLVLRTQILAEGRTAVTATVVIVIVTEEEVDERGGRRGAVSGEPPGRDRSTGQEWSF